jgi:uncharacterized protein (DUF58 family)
MEVSSLWKNLPITILKPVRQRTGFRILSSRTADRGFHLSGLRQFQIGDSFRSVSRKHYARTGEEVIIERHPEQNALILILIDISASMFVGSVRRKIDVSLDFLMHFGSACLWQGNKIKVLAFSKGVEFESDVIAAFGAFEHLREELIDLVPDSRHTDHSEVIEKALLISERLNVPADLVCIVSDFLFPSPHEYFYRDLILLHEKADVIGLLIRDLMEETVPKQRGCLKVRDAETGKFLWLSGISSPAILQKLDKQGFETCMLTTAQNDQQWYETLEDFFSLRKEAFYK